MHFQAAIRVLDIGTYIKQEKCTLVTYGGFIRIFRLANNLPSSEFEPMPIQFNRQEVQSGRRNKNHIPHFDRLFF